jgi:hypothetical protein
MRNGGTTLWDEIPNATGSSMVEFIREGKGKYSASEVNKVFALYIDVPKRRQREADMFNGNGYNFYNYAVDVWFRESMVSEGRPL